MLYSALSNVKIALLYYLCSIIFKEKLRSLYVVYVFGCVASLKKFYHPTCDLLQKLNLK